MNQVYYRKSIDELFMLLGQKVPYWIDSKFGSHGYKNEWFADQWHNRLADIELRQVDKKSRKGKLYFTKTDPSTYLNMLLYKKDGSKKYLLEEIAGQGYGTIIKAAKNLIRIRNQYAHFQEKTNYGAELSSARKSAIDIFRFIEEVDCENDIMMAIEFENSEGIRNDTDLSMSSYIISRTMETENVDSKVIYELYKDSVFSSIKDRLGLAMCYATTPEVLFELCKDPEAIVRYRVLCRVLVDLSQTTVNYERYDKILKKLIDDDSVYIRYHLMKFVQCIHFDIPSNILEKLKNDPYEPTRNAALITFSITNPNELAKFSKSKYEVERIAVAGSMFASNETLKYLTQDSSGDVLLVLAQNKKNSREVFDILWSNEGLRPYLVMLGNASKNKLIDIIKSNDEKLSAIATVRLNLDYEEGGPGEIDPQDDFFQHVNKGQLMGDGSIAGGNKGQFYEVGLRTQNQISKLLLDPEQKGLENVWTLLMSFFDSDRIEKLGIRPIENQVLEIESIESISDLEQFLSEYIPIGMSKPFLIGPYWDPNRAEFCMQINRGELSLSDELYHLEDSHIKEDFIDHLKAIFELWDKYKLNTKGINVKNLDNTSKLAESLFEFERKLSNSLQNVTNEEANNSMSIAEFDNTFAGFSIMKLFPYIDPESKVYVCQPEFFFNLANLWTDDNIDIWKTWLKYHWIKSWESFLPKVFFKKFHKFRKKHLRGKDDIVSLINHISDMDAIQFVSVLLGDEIGKPYIDKYYKGLLQFRVEEFVQSIFETYKIAVSRANWLSSNAKAKVLDKLLKINKKVGYPKQWKDYSGLNLSKDNPIENIQSIYLNNHQNNVNIIGKQPSEEEWAMTPQTVNAGYFPPANEIYLPAALFQLPLFDPRRKDEQNYGGIGVIIAHEISHLFMYGNNKIGKDLNSAFTWDEDADDNNFNAICEKIKKQFDGLVPRQLVSSPDDQNHVNGSLTSNENFADICGLEISLLACAMSRGFDNTEDFANADKESVQEFFVAYAKAWLSNVSDDNMVLLLKIDVHSPNEFRVNAVKNLNAFHIAFDTKESDGMWLAPDERIHIFQ